MSTIKEAITEKDFSDVPDEDLAFCLELIACFVQTDDSKSALLEAAKRLKQSRGAA